MKDEELKALFDAAASQPPREEARQQALKAAEAAFDAQGNDAADRPTTNLTRLFRRKPMSSLTQPRIYAGFASAAAVVLAVAVVFDMDVSSIDTSSINDPMIPPVPKVAAPRDQDAGHTLDAGEPPGALRQSSPALEESRASANRKMEIAETSRSTANFSDIRQAPMESLALGKARSASADSMTMTAPMRPPVADPMPPGQPGVSGRDRFESFETNPVRRVAEEPVSTFSIDVDTASYSFIRRQLNQGVLPQKAAVRLEELVNYFPYDYPGPASRSEPFAASVSVLDSPWKAGNQLVHIGIKGYEVQKTASVGSNLVFLLDVSGSMNQPDKLPLVKQSMSLLLSQLNPEDTVAIAVYAGAAGTVLEPTPVRDRQKILAAMNRLQAGGSTAGGAGIRLAYQLAEANFIKGGVNRVFLATDGDFNVGITADGELEGFIERKRDSGIYLSVLGFGQGNYQDALMQKLAQNGNGIAAYIDSLGEAQKVLVEEAQSMLFPIANDVKLQVEFNPATVSEYRLLGYETRALNREDFNNDKVDAGEIGAGHSVTAIYEITPVGTQGLIDAPRYGESPATRGEEKGEYGFLKIRYKLPGETSSRLMSTPILANRGSATIDSQFAVAVAGFAQLLKDSRYIDNWTLQDALDLAIASKGEDPYGYRAEFTQLIRKAMVAEDMQP